MNVYFSPAYAGAAYAFETTRKSMWVAESLSADPIGQIQLCAPQPLTVQSLVRVHNVDFVQAVRYGEPRDLAQSQGFTWDAGLWPMVLASNGGMVAAALDALGSGLSGSLSSGLHHARRERGMGYCTFNGLAIAALEAISAGAREVLILDLDAHCGGGTAQILAAEPHVFQLDISVDDYDSYDQSNGAQLHLVRDASEYLSVVERQLQRLAAGARKFDLCLYNAGMDPFEGCPDGALTGITRSMLVQRERIVFDWCRRQGIPVAFSLAGGYVGENLDRQGLVELHRLTLAAAASIAA